MVQAEQHVSAQYSDDYFFNGGAGYADYLKDEELLRNRGRWYAKLLNRSANPGRILDVGAAAGFILKGFADGGWAGKGIEPNDRMASIARNRLGLEVLTGMLENLPADETFDAVSMIQVLPHFIDPRHAMGVVAKVLKPGGLLVIETWNRNSWTAYLMGQSWHEYSPPSVLHWFDPKGLTQLVTPFGFKKVSMGRPPKRISGAHAKSLLRHTLGQSWAGKAAAVCLSLCPDNAALPYPAEDLMWMLFQKQPE